MTKSKKNQLKKSLGLGFGIAILIGGTIGVGILRTQVPSRACWTIIGLSLAVGF